MDDEYLEFILDGKTFRATREVVEHMREADRRLKAHLAALGQLSWSFAGLDRSVDRLFETLLQCSEMQVACLMVENISTRCSQLVRLLYVETELDADFREWVEHLLNRVSGEIAGERNRFVHDRWALRWSEAEKSFTRTDKRPNLGKAQSRQPRTLTINQQHPATAEDMENLSGRMETVSFALQVADHNLAVWRQTGRLPELDARWLPTSRPKARAHWDEAWNADEKLAPPPSRIELPQG